METQAIPATRTSDDVVGPSTTRRRYLMCRPSFFTVSYQINPWMDTSRPVDTARAVEQWERLADVHRDLGHEVDLIEPLTGLPDMVYAANGATVVDGVAYSALFKHRERAAEGPAYLEWFAEHGFTTRDAQHINEGEGDLLVAGSRVLAGFGFRTERSAHAEVAALWHREVVSLELVDPRFYHLDTALTVLRGNGPGPAGFGDDAGTVEVAYYPPAFSPESQERLRALYPDAILASEADAVVLGLNSVSDGQHVVINPAATGYEGALRERGYDVVGVDTSELLLGGGGAKCCTLVVRS